MPAYQVADNGHKLLRFQQLFLKPLYVLKIYTGAIGTAAESELDLGVENILMADRI
jgi:hypothetical protein